MIGTAFGPGRNDEVIRLYSTQITANTVKEFTYGEGAWSNTSNIALPFYAERALELGDGQGDKVVRVYAGEFFGGGRATEYTWDGGAWSSTLMGSTGQQLLNLVMGPGRNDDVTRLYFPTGSAPPNNAVREFSFSGNTWTESPIANSPGASVGGFGIDLGDGRNDGVTRVYDGTTGNGFLLYEFSWDGAQWNAVRIAAVPSQIMGVAVGDGQNDGINRVYAVGRAFGIYEYTYSNGAWSLTNSIPVGQEVFDVALGP